MVNLYVSKVTKAGQISVPKELRSRMGFNEADYVSMEPRGSAILLRKVRPYEDLLDYFRAETKRKGITRKDVQGAIDEIRPKLVKRIYGL